MINEGRLFDSYSNLIQNILELPFYGLYVLHFRNNMNNTYVDTNLTTSRTVFNGCSGCSQTSPWTYQISDRKFIKAISIDLNDPILGNYDAYDVGFIVKDTTPSTLPIDTIEEVYRFGEINHLDMLCGLDFVAPDTVYLLYKFVDTTISYKDVYTLQKSTTTGSVFWSKNYTCDVNRWLAIEATDNEILMYGRFWQGDSHLDDLYTSNPMIVRLDKEGVILSTNDVSFQHADVMLYPNPTNSILNLRIENSDCRFENFKIFNIMGQCVYNAKVPKSSKDVNFKIDISDFSKGTYFLQMIGDDSHVTKKFVVN